MRSRVLIIDDDFGHAESLSEVLSAIDFEPYIALNGEEGIKRFREDNFDIVLTDYKMPGLSGIDVSIELHKIRPDAKVILMTGFSLKQLIDKVLDDRLLALLQLPIDGRKLSSLFDQLKPNSRIVLVDPLHDLGNNFRISAAKTTHRLSTVGSIQEALEHIISFGVDCLALKLEMPLLHVFELYLKAKDAAPSFKTIFITDFDVNMKISKIHSLKNYDCDILTKPLNISEFIQIMSVAKELVHSQGPTDFIESI